MDSHQLNLRTNVRRDVPGDSAPGIVCDDPDREKLTARVLAWYDVHARRLPWRRMAGARPNPYSIWLSEIMLQQTTVATVGPYYAAFLDRWPTVTALAEASLNDVLGAWAGLGYYSRARNLHKCAGVVVAEHGGRFPETEEVLIKLPGIGPYTAAAIAAIAFDRRTLPVDGNIERVVARLFSIETPLPQAKKEIAVRARPLAPKARAGDFAQALMDLGASVCVPRTPKCSHCPVTDDCMARAKGNAASLPIRAPKTAIPTRRGIAYWTLDSATHSLCLVRRPPKGLLGGMLALPVSDWDARPEDEIFTDSYARSQAPCRARWRRIPGLVQHTFTHFHLELVVYRAEASPTAIRKLAGEGNWTALDELPVGALPTLMRKVVAHMAPDGVR